MKNTTAATADTDSADADTYVRASDFADHIAGVRFPSEIWAVFAQCDAPRTPAEIALRARLDTTQVLSALDRLAGKRLVKKDEMDWQSYLAAQGAPPAEIAPVAAPAVVITPPRETVVAAAKPAPPTPAPSPAPALAVAPEPVPSADQPLEFTLVNVSAAIARRQAAREVLTFLVGKPSARETRPVLAA